MIRTRFWLLGCLCVWLLVACQSPEGLQVASSTLPVTVTAVPSATTSPTLSPIPSVTASTTAVLPTHTPPPSPTAPSTALSAGVPTCLHGRLPQAHLRPGCNHWLDVLIGSVERHLYTYEAQAAQLESEATPPLAIFQHGLHWRESGAKLCQVYQQAARQHPGSFDRIQQAVMGRMKVDLPGLLSGAAAHIYTHGLSDAVLWQLDFGDGRAGVARAWLEELRRIGLIGEAIWTKEGTVRFYSEPVETGVPVQLNGVWFNISDSEHTSMSQVTPAEAKAMKAACAQQRFVNRVLLTDILDDDRLIVRTPDGRLFGYVQRGQELRLLKKNRWVIRWTAVRDGNVYAVVS